MPFAVWRTPASWTVIDAEQSLLACARGAAAASLTGTSTTSEITQSASAPHTAY